MSIKKCSVLSIYDRSTLLSSQGHRDLHYGLYRLHLGRSCGPRFPAFCYSNCKHKCA